MCLWRPAGTLYNHVLKLKTRQSLYAVVLLETHCATVSKEHTCAQSNLFTQISKVVMN